MELLKLFCSNFSAAEQQKLAEDVQAVRDAWEKRSEAEGKAESVTLDLIVKIVNKNIFKNLCYIRVLGISDQTFLLSSSHVVKQNYNLCLHVKAIALNLEDFFFSITPESKLKILFLPESYMIANLRPICSEYIYDTYLTANFRGFFKNNYVEFTDLREYNDRNYIPLIKGLVLKKSRLKDCIILNLLDLRNFIDTFKLYVNFKYVEEINGFDKEVQPNDVITVRDNIKKTITKKLQIAYAMQYHRNTKIDVVRQTKYIFKNFKARKRIEKNVKNVDFPLTELVNLQPHIFHRGLVKLIARVLKILYVEIRVFCKKCLLKPNFCTCAQSQFENIDFFCALICQNSNLTFCASLKGAENFMSFFEVTAAELEYIIEYMKNDGEVKYTFGSFVSFESKLAVVMTILEKQLGDKIVWGKPCSKLAKFDKEDKNFCVNFLKVRHSTLYPNGMIRHNSNKNTIFYVFDIKIKHVEDDQAMVSKAKFQLLLSKLLL